MDDNVYSFLVVSGIIFVTICMGVCIYFSIIACTYLIRRDTPSILSNSIDRNSEVNPLNSSE